MSSAVFSHPQSCETDSLLLSLNEVGLLFLLRSHKETCSLLGHHVCTAMAECFPQDWRQRIGECFSDATRRCVLDELKSTGRIADFFVLCKTIRSYIRRVFFIRKPLLSTSFGKHPPNVLVFNQAEYMNSVVQSVEAVRHAVFHEQDVAVEEIASALTYAARVLPSMSSAPVDQRSSQLLCSFETEFKELNAGVRTAVWADTLEGAHVLVLRCLRKLGEDLKQLLGEAIPTDADKYVPVFCKGGTARMSLADIFKALKKHNGRQEVWALRKKGVKVNVVQVCNKLIALRNKLAHGKPTSLSYIQRTLQETEQLWKAFQIDQSAFKQIVDYFSQFEAKTGKHRVNVLSVVNIPKSPLSQRNTNARTCERRPMRQMDCVFVGRECELQMCAEFLSKNGLFSIVDEQCLLIIQGVSGVGKSALARRLLHEAETFCVGQLWLCASTRDILLEELEAQLFPFQLEHFKAIRKLSPLERFRFILKQLSPHIIVLDDVHSDLIEFVLLLVQNTRHAIVFTTCHLSKTNVGTLMKSFRTSLSIHLTCLSTEASLQLIRKRGISVDQDSKELVETIISEKLDNLPLLVNLFSSLLKKKFLANSQKQTSMKGWLNDVMSCLGRHLFLEDCYGVDRFHVRGLVGLVCLALEDLQNDPATFSLMVIIAAIFPSGIPWKFFELDWKPSMAYVEKFGENSQESAVCIHSSIECLFGERQELRFASREKLLRLGLVWWNESNSSVHMHSLLQSFILDQISEGGLLYRSIPWPVSPTVCYKALVTALLAEEIVDSLPELLAVVEGKPKRIKTWSNFWKKHLVNWGASLLASVPHLCDVFQSTKAILPLEVQQKMYLSSGLFRLSLQYVPQIDLDMPTSLITDWSWESLQKLISGVVIFFEDSPLIGSWFTQSWMRYEQMEYMSPSSVGGDGHRWTNRNTPYLVALLVIIGTHVHRRPDAWLGLPQPVTIFSLLGMPAIAGLLRSAAAEMSASVDSLNDISKCQDEHLLFPRINTLPDTARLADCAPLPKCQPASCSDDTHSCFTSRAQSQKFDTSTALQKLRALSSTVTKLLKQALGRRVECSAHVSGDHFFLPAANCMDSNLMRTSG